MATFTVNIGAAALADVQNAIDYYDEAQPGLGAIYLLELEEFFVVLEENPHFEIRYDEVRCLPLKKFPFMIHFTLDEEAKSVNIRAVLHTSLNPKSWKKRS